MESALIKLKAILNSISNEDLKEMELWINHDKKVEVVVVDDNSISLITNERLLKIDGYDW